MLMPVRSHRGDTLNSATRAVFPSGFRSVNRHSNDAAGSVGAT